MSKTAPKKVKALDKEQNVPDKVLGKMAPSITLNATGDQKINLKDLRGQRLVLYFYPKDSTPGCTVEGQDFSNLKSKFEKLNTLILGVSRDSLKSHENFKAKQKYKIDLLADEDEKLCTWFDVVKMKNMYGKQVRGIERSTFIIDEAGKVVKSWRKVKVEGHAQEVFDFVKAM